MATFMHLQAVIPESFITQLRQRAEVTLSSIYNDYSSKKSFEEFKSSHLAHNESLHLAHSESLVMKLATFRFASAEILTKLRDLVSPHIHCVCGDSRLLIHPLFFLRFNFPGTYYSDKHRMAFLATEPHYDHYAIQGFLVRAITFWVALDDVDEESGGLCLFSTKEITDYFTTPNGGTRYDYNAYLELSQEVDPIIQRGTVAPAIRAGDVLAFDSTTILHGATKPRSRRRVSFDFRLVPSANLKGSPVIVHKIFDELNSAYDIYNANKLIHLGDFLGASQILRKVSSATDNRDLQRVASALGNRSPDAAILKAGAL